ETINWYVSRSSFEYVPKGVPIVRGELGTNLIDIQESQIPQEKIVADQSKLKIKNLETSPHRIRFAALAEESSIVTINTFNFPGWTAKIDGQNTSIIDNNRYKLISINIPKGDHRVQVQFKDTQVRKIANYLSLFSLLLMGLVLTKFLIVPYVGKSA
ncbi:hypothetical protein HYZ70_01250, partial [Candidatus Curtissbacteria bacterium]|nr:hypothetical protein [Candidatus Curtissbacteria bacterium]